MFSGYDPGQLRRHSAEKWTSPDFAVLLHLPSPSRQAERSEESRQPRLNSLNTNEILRCAQDEPRVRITAPQDDRASG